MSEVIRLEAPRDGGVLVTAVPVVTEREIVRDRDNIIQTLHAAYLALCEDMADFQHQWDADPTKAFLDSARAGASQGAADWLGDQAALFDKKTWVEIGHKVENFTGDCLDRMATYSKQQYQDLAREINKHVSNPERTLYNWAWWQRTIEDEARAAVDSQRARLNAAVASVNDTASSMLATAEKAQKLYKHRDAILNLPSLIAIGDPKPIQAFVENELMDIDPKLAKAIRNDPRFSIVLEIIADNESALSFLAYASLMIEAIPPNFYAFIAGKGAIYIVIEVILLVVTALLSAGAAAATRVAWLVARLTSASAKLAGAAAKVRRAKAALDAFVRMLEDLMRAVNELHDLGGKLIRARLKGLSVRGSTKTKLTAKKESIRRDKRCRICGRTDHPTPRHRRGHVVYR
ncbi:hypothetical protein [Pseudoduganella buxea]|uniref:Uncharacterized protein n=1 Tax=Pseudoduganella buxea TaxID=1949069 RepID=A0A6I3SV69_9BURK|nr:hypothetical protein [Pseudoduganella buxea]MTV53033.1 hypothetical protein [Pseudoduganella buxea]GGC07993.1 hypothetical protein GCM10011572_32010 [Pseudoduganella buxea]